MTAILGIGAAVPQYKMNQLDLAALIAKSLELDDVQSQRYQKIAKHSSIEHRYSVLDDFAEGLVHRQEFLGESLPQSQPSLYRRNIIYKQQAPLLASAAVKNAIKNWGGNTEEITHLIVVSCTGIIVPGIDVLLTESLSLQPDVERYGIHFMGCFGAFKGLAVADALCHENSNNKVLVVCVELCTLHFQDSENEDTLLSNLLFADGSAAAILGQDDDGQAKCRIVKRQSYLLPDSQCDMSWDIGSVALEMRISKRVPEAIREYILPFVEGLVGEENIESADFIIHPGGKAILHGVERACSLAKSQTTASWEVLRDYGNMSSATVLFILERYLQQQQLGRNIVMLGFGPGLTVEGMLLGS
ncbi:MAG: type III polyketide synthase [Coxiellaceae bacterium]|nr:type III polyketide synthase [Coxiellaceae bacterium]